ncbi:hypothetical protein AKO1_009136 [Acrasis kona]|uniref:KIF-binding protein n=1 Tax=Acrasis kona TaxID=1008807 RepID=A0AAW2ZJM3_9EUKA
MIQPGDDKLEINLEIKIDTPVPSCRMVIKIQDENSTKLEWCCDVMTMGSRRKKKTRKDSELSVCFGPLWPMVDVEIAILNNKKLNNPSLETISEDSNSPTTSLLDSVLNVLNPTNQPDQLFKNAEEIMKQSSNNQHAMALLQQYLTTKYPQTNSLLDVLEDKSIQSILSERDLVSMIYLCELHCRYDAFYRQNNHKVTDYASEAILRLASERNPELFLKAAYQCAANDLSKGWEETKQNRHYAITVYKCDRGIGMIPREKSTETEMLESDLYCLKATALSKFHLFGGAYEEEVSDPNELGIDEANRRIGILCDIMQCRHRAFEIRVKLCSKSTAFAEICNDISCSLLSYYYLFRCSEAYTPTRAIVILNVVRKLQSKAVNLQRQYNTNMNHLAFVEYKYMLKCCDYELAVENAKSGEVGQNDVRAVEKLYQERGNIRLQVLAARSQCYLKDN